MHKRGLSALLSVVMTMSILPTLPASALENDEPFPYTLFAGSEEDGAITINADNICLNGNIVTNGSIETTATNFNVNGQRIEHSQQAMVYAFGKLDDAYFDSDNVLIYESDYTVEDINISLNTPVVSTGNISLNGNINLNTQLKAEEDILVSGSSCNANNAALISHHGDIYIESTNFGFAGLIYAPYGDIVIDANSLNLNNVVVIGQTITIDSPNLNVNHNQNVANVIGTISEDPDDHHGNTDNYFYAAGAYNEETSTIDIAWYGTVLPDTINVLASSDGENYSVVATVTDATTYSYPVGDCFISTYFKVSYIDVEGSIIESIPFHAIVTETGIVIDYPDSDDDGIADILEAIIGTDPNKSDSDDDGLTDYQELNITGTDPADYDSVQENLSDSDADSDDDGISNIHEIELGTNPLIQDSDDDSLTDGEEVNTYLTNPLLEDTDDDSLTDGFEVRYGLDPLSPYTDGLLDAERRIEQSILADSPIFSEVNTSDSPYEMSISVTTNGDAEQELVVAESGYAVSLKNDAQIGGIADLTISDSCEPDSIRLAYKIKDAYRSNTLNKYSKFEDLQGIKRLCVFKYFDEIRMMLPLDTQYDIDNNTIYADVDEDGTYCVMDLELWFNIFGIDPDQVSPLESASNVNNSSVTPLRSPLRATTSTTTNAVVNNTPINIYILLQGSGHDADLYQEQVAAIEDFSSAILSEFPISFIVLTEQSYFRGEELIPGSGIYPGGNSIVYDYFSSNSLDDNNRIQLSPHGYYQFAGYEFDDNSGLYSALDTALASDNCQCKFVFDFQNGNLHVDSSNNILAICENYDCIYSRFHSDDYTYETNIYDYNGKVHQAILNSKGIELTNTDTAAAEMIELIRSNIPWSATMLLSTSLKRVQLKTILSPTNGTNSDEDTLTDWDETDNRYITVNTDGTISLPTIQDLLAHIDINGILNYAGNQGAARNEMFKAIQNWEVLPCKSDPTSKDTDGDKIDDDSDPKPIKAFNNLFAIVDNIDSIPEIDFMNIDKLGTGNSEFEPNAYGIKFGTVGKDGRDFCYKRKSVTPTDQVTYLALKGGAWAASTRAFTSTVGEVINDTSRAYRASEYVDCYLKGDGALKEMGESQTAELILCFYKNMFHFMNGLNMMLELGEDAVNENETKCFSTMNNDIKTICFNDKHCPFATAVGDNHKFSIAVNMSHSDLARDWEYAIGDAFGALVCQVSKHDGIYSMTYKYYIFDYYEFAYHVSGQEWNLHALHECGLAKDYPIMGVITDTFSWREGERLSIPQDVSIILSKFLDPFSTIQEAP